MNVDAVLVLNRSDVLRIAAEPQRYEGVRLLFVDPGLLDEAVQQGLRHYDFRPLAVGPDFHARASAEAQAQATLLDQSLTEERMRLWPGLCMQGWDVGLFFLALLRAGVTRRLGALMEASFPEARIGLLRPRLPQQMYFDSYIGTDLVGLDAGRFAVVDSYDTVRWQNLDAYTQVFDAAALATLMAPGHITAVTHVPTCFYDRAWLAEEVTRCHEHAAELPSPFWDVPLRGHRVPLLALAAQPADERALAYKDRAAGVLQDCLGKLLPNPVARAQQVQAWAARCHWQAVNFSALRQGFAGTRPHFLLSDQDTGCNGPVFSVADELGAALTVVPHSGHPSMVVPHDRRVTMVERAGYGTRGSTVLGQPVQMRPVRYPRQAERKLPGRVRTVCLLLNAMQNESLSYIDLQSLAAFYKPLAALCEAADVELLLRPKPGAPAPSVLGWALGIEAGSLLPRIAQPLSQVAEAAQLCVAYGDPTTGVTPFLDAGSLVLQVHTQSWPAHYLHCMPLVADRVIPLLDNAGALARVQALIKDPQLFEQARQAQLAIYDQRWNSAHDHLFTRTGDPVVALGETANA